jgi:hypothetical protein
MKHLIIFNITLFSLLIFISCEKDNTNINEQENNTAEKLPLLSSGNKIGTIIGFNPSNPPATEDSINDRWNEAINAGMPVGRLQIDWMELEPQPGIYNKTALKNKLSELNDQNLQTFLLISAYDSNGPELPTDLDGLKMDNPVVIERFKKLMDWVIPMLVEYNGYIISITNEADNHFGEEPNLHVEILNFLKSVKRHVHSINNKMAVTVTIAEGSLDTDKPGITQIIEHCDVACWNFYGAKEIPQTPYYKPQTENEIIHDIQRMLDISGDKNIVIQELGMWSGSDILNSSEEIQEKFFEVFFQQMEQEERIRSACVFQLVDWSPEVTDLFLQAFEDEELPQEFIDAFAESLETIGLINYSNGERKMAWKTFTKWIRKYSKE